MTTHWIYAGLIAGVGCALYLTSNQPDTPETTEKPDSESTSGD